VGWYWRRKALCEGDCVAKVGKRPNREEWRPQNIKISGHCHPVLCSDRADLDGAALEQSLQNHASILSLTSRSHHLPDTPPPAHSTQWLSISLTYHSPRIANLTRSCRHSSARSTPSGMNCARKDSRHPMLGTHTHSSKPHFMT
jgi:hypothetical protein